MIAKLMRELLKHVLSLTLKLLQWTFAGVNRVGRACLNGGKRMLPALFMLLCVLIALSISYFVIGWLVVNPILENFIEARRITQENVGVFEAISVFLVVMTYMLVTTVLVLISIFIGYMRQRLFRMEFSIRNLLSVFSADQSN